MTINNHTQATVSFTKAVIFEHSH